MKCKNLLLSTVIAPMCVVTMVACSSSDDDAGNNITAEETVADVLLFDEADGGDIVNDPNNPLPLQLVIGENRINAAVVSPDLDYLTVNVPAGSLMTAIELAAYTSTDDRSFIAIQAGSVFTEQASDPDVANLLGYLHFGVESVGEDILPGMSAGEGAQGFTTPLEAGDYSFWIQETGADPVNYSLVFVVESL